MARRDSGFSLIELLIVIGIISILVSIGISKYKQFKIKAYNSVALYDLKNLISAELSYYGINQQFVSFSTYNINSNGIVIKGNFTHKYISNQVRAVAKVNGDYANFCTKHKMGTLIYGYQSETDTIYYKKSQQNYELQDFDCPNATSGNDFISWKILAQSK